MAEEAHRNADLEVATIYEISEILSSSPDLPKTLRDVLNVLASHIGIRRGMVSLVQESGELHLLGGVGLSADEILRPASANGARKVSATYRGWLSVASNGRGPRLRRSTPTPERFGRAPAPWGATIWS